MRPSELIDPADRLRIESAVIDAERSTAGEIVVAVVHECDEYGSAGWRFGVTLAALVYLLLASSASGLPLWAYLAAQGVALAVGHLLGRRDGLRRRFISETLMETRVAERAQRAFAENGLQRTARRTGILIFVALLERRVVVLADEGIDMVLDPGEAWGDVVELALQGLRTGRAADGLIAAVQRCGKILAHHLPAPERNVDELPNAVVMED